MKKILIIFLFLFSQTAISAIQPPDELATNGGYCGGVCASWNNNCGAYYGNPKFFAPGTRDPDVGFLCDGPSSCPQGFNNVNGVCKPLTCTLPEVVNIVTNNGVKVASCIVPSTGGSGGESSSSSSNSSSPSCPAGQHWDFTVNGQPVVGSTCVPDSASSSASSHPVSSTSSSPPVSSSASSPSSSPSSLPSSTGNRDEAPTSSTELCELNFGVGNCTAVSQSSPCANSYTVNGQKFCVGQSESNSSGSAFSGSSGGGGASAPSVTATANNCSAQPTCTGGDPIQCAILRQSWLNFCDGAENETDINADSDNSNIQTEFDRLVNDNQTDLNQDGTISGVQGEVDFSQYADMVGNLNNAAGQASSGNCPAPRALQMSFGSYELSYQPMCELAEGMSYFVLLFFSITGALIIYRTVERI